ncbi:5-dehydro-2-deoxygluconokinase [Paenibacillus cisolokensis]|jgi:5-dehydro-2-deoxygluconokinase|uniref:5-dehydro-2-deoxygluconokinase n=1 Tax=Paenibacillus cisolokensis TaxID=1658519 RepID=A0ABQ4NFA6_9BACL|nr:5-dehydro-2-deoxygluconokinase [Paenibacillus cisolokensis]GIQ66556.1 5-dehydro-2-deoxygluconokinase [Paenibacillus cisolokensis]
MTLPPFAAGRPLDVIGLGRLCIDLNANEIHRPMEETRTFTKYVGGSPANITIALARLGEKTGFIGRVSDDQHGRFITRYLEERGIDTSHVITDKSGSVTGLAFTEIKSPTDCSILMYRDNVADLKLEPGDIDAAYIGSAKALLVSGTALAASPSREAALKAIHVARECGTVVIFDIDYRPYTWTSREETGIYCSIAAAKSDVILGGREEFDLLDAVYETPHGDDRRTAERWLRESAGIVVVKRGGDGSTVYARDGRSWTGRTFPAQVVKTFGAGDAFAGAFIHGLLHGWDIERCQLFGSAAASIVVASHSCSDAMPTAEQIEGVIGRYANG